MYGVENMKVYNFLIGIICFLFGGMDALMVTLLIVIGIDYITGVLKAIYQKNLSSKMGLYGIIKKCGYLLIVVLSVQADKLLGNESMALRTVVIYSFIANESLSILENWGKMGLPLPNKLVKALSSLKEDDK